jgi:hypothetical protein
VAGFKMPGPEEEHRPIWQLLQVVVLGKTYS